MNRVDSQAGDSEPRKGLGTWVPLAALILNGGIVGLTFGLTFPLLGLLLERDAVDPTWIGLNSAATPFAVLLASPFVPRLLDRVGFMWALMGALAVIFVVVLLLPLWTGLAPWFLLRFVLGVADAVHWIACETWVIALTTAANRGRILALYFTFLSGGMALGPAVIRIVGIEGVAPFAVCAALIAVAGLCLLAARRAEPKMPPRAKAVFLLALRVAPLLLAAAILAGYTEMTMLALFPVYLVKLGLGQEVAVSMLTAALIGGVVLQLPIGWLSDRMDRRRLLVIGGVMMLGLPFLLGILIATGSFWLWPLLLVWGALPMGLNTVGLAMIGDRFQPNAIAGANAAFVALFETGSLAGPAIGGVGMNLFGPPSLIWVFAGGALLFLILAACRSIAAGVPRTTADRRNDGD